MSDKGFNKIVGHSEEMLRFYYYLRQAAAAEIPVLLLGETGTGKDLAAQVIHENSSRRDKPFLGINLGALPKDLVASELFGHEKGSFTGAGRQHQGIFERGSGGTVFLDEIECISDKVQVTLLRLIEQKTFNRLGGTRIIRSNARIIVASNRNLEKLVRTGEFREDLFYRLDVFRITLPPLRKRKEDIPLLVSHFLKMYSNEFNKEIKTITDECVDLLTQYTWPGNVRELKNIIRRAVLMTDGNQIQIQDLPARIQKVKDEDSRFSVSIGTPLEIIEKEAIEKTLQMTLNNRTAAATYLGITRRALYNKLHKYGIC